MPNTDATARHPPDHKDRKLRAMQDLRRKLRSLSATNDLLLELMGFGHFAEMAMTRDGLLIGRPHRSVGFDAFIGSVTETMRRRTSRLWCELDNDERGLVLQRLAAQQIDPRCVGIPAERSGPPVPASTTSADPSGG